MILQVIEEKDDVKALIERAENHVIMADEPSETQAVIDDLVSTLRRLITVDDAAVERVARTMFENMHGLYLGDATEVERALFYQVARAALTAHVTHALSEGNDDDE